MADVVNQVTNTLQIFSALCSDVYHNNNQDQWINLSDINKNLTVDATTQLAGLTNLGFTAAPDGFYCTTNGFGARLIQDTTADATTPKYIIVFRGSDLGRSLEFS
jgi:ribosomal protein S12 methylthiotransferase accessory factor YcaO